MEAGQPGYGRELASMTVALAATTSSAVVPFAARASGSSDRCSAFMK